MVRVVDCGGVLRSDNVAKGCGAGHVPVKTCDDRWVFPRVARGRGRVTGRLTNSSPDKKVISDSRLRAYVSLAVARTWSRKRVEPGAPPVRRARVAPRPEGQRAAGAGADFFRARYAA